MWGYGTCIVDYSASVGYAYPPVMAMSRAIRGNRYERELKVGEDDTSNKDWRMKTSVPVGWLASRPKCTEGGGR